jgi:hypothetical protein
VTRRTARALTALADGTLPQHRRDALQRRVTRSTELSRALEAQRLALEVVRPRRDLAPPGLRAWVERATRKASEKGAIR